MKLHTNLTLAICLLSLTSAGQDLKRSYTLKLYGNWNHTPVQTTNENVINDQRISRLSGSNELGLLTPAVQIQYTNRSFTEVELTGFVNSNTREEFIREDLSLGVSTIQGGQDIQTFSSAIRVGQHWNLTPDKEGKLSPFIGISVLPGFTRVKTESVTSNSYSSTNTSFSGLASITPRLQYRFTDRFLVDLNIPIHVFRASHEKINVNNPNFTTEQQTTTSSEVGFFPRRYSVSLGIGLAL